MNTLRCSLQIAAKDLRIGFRDRTGLALGFLLPIVLMLVFGFIYKLTWGRSDGGTISTELHVADSDKSPASAKFVAALRASELLAVRPREGEPAAEPEALRKLVEEGDDAHHALVIEPGFGAALERREIPRLTLYRDPGRRLESRLVGIGMLQAAMSAFGIELAPALTANALIRAGLPEAYAEQALAISKGISLQITQLFGDAHGTKPGDGGGAAGGDLDLSAVFDEILPVEKVDVKRPARAPILDYMMAHNVAGIVTMMLMFGMLACATLLLTERDQGTLKRLLAMPVPLDSLLFGKLLYCGAMGAMQLAIMFAVGRVAFGVNVLRDPITLLVVSAVLIFSITGFGVLVAALSRTQKQAEGIATLLILVMSALGGAWFPLDQFNLPTAAETVSRSTLTYWSMHGLRGMLYHGKDLTDPGLLLDVAVLCGFGVVALAIARAVFRARALSAARGA